MTQCRKQRIALIAGFVLILSMALFPPWLTVYDIPADKDRVVIPARGRAERSAGYHFLFQQDNSRSMSTYVDLSGETAAAYRSTKIDTLRLGVQLIGALLLTGIAYLILRT
jgi:hypothetical protein